MDKCKLIRKMRGNIPQCSHCRAPQRSIFEAAPMTGRMRKYILDTDEFKVTRFISDTGEGLNERCLKKIRAKKIVKSIRLKSSNIFPSSLAMASNAHGPTCSGSTFMSEYEDFVLNLNYESKKTSAEIGRKKWRKLKKMLKIEQFRQKVSNAGPEWFQDLSQYQIDLTDNLPTMLHRDIEEGKIPRTQEYLFEVGIAPNLPPKVISDTVKEYGENAVAFLFKLHEALAKIESEQYEKSYWEAKNQKKKISPYSVNERILLTCAFHLHYPTFLKKLGKILPPPKPQPKVLWAKKPPKPKRKTFSSPYLEPLPLPEKPWYEQRLEDELQAKVERQMMRQNARLEKAEFEKKLAEQKKLDEKEKEERERARQALVLQNKIKEKSKLKKMKQKHIISDQNLLGIEHSSEQGILPMRERKSEFFKQLCSRSKQSITDKLKETEEKVIVEPEKMVEDHQSAIEDPELWMEIMASDGCAQTAIRGIGQDTLYAAHMKDDSLPKEGITEASPLEVRKALEGNLRDSWSQTPFTNEFRPIKKAMRDFLLKQRGIEKQMEKFYSASMYKRGIFGPPTNSVCRTSCLLDLERMAINREITVIKAPSVGSYFSDEHPKSKVPKDFSMKELLSVKRLPNREGPLSAREMSARRMSGPPLPEARDLKESTEIVQPEESLHVDTEPSYVSTEVTEQPDIDPISLSKKPIPVECTDPGCELVSPDDIPIDEFTLARKRISLFPIHKQLQAAIQYLCDKGDPLAVLPDISQVPWLIRWFDKRNGIKRNLTEKDKAELMDKSLTFWNADYISCKEAPLPILPKGYFTWSNKNWMNEYLKKLVYEHQRKVKHILIDNARDLFPSMFCEYFDTPLNKAFRKTFYTYFPSCERDCLVNKPWDPKAENEKKDNEV